MSFPSRIRSYAVWAFSAVIACVLLFCAYKFIPEKSIQLSPEIYGFKKVETGIYVEPDISEAQLSIIEKDVSQGTELVAAFFGGIESKPILIFCSSEHCYRRVAPSFAKARAVTLGKRHIIFSPRRLGSTIIAHEMVHSELNQRIGSFAMLSGSVPAWFNEGLAVLVSEDKRFKADMNKTPCDRKLDFSKLRLKPDWNRAADSDYSIYGVAACRVKSVIGDGKYSVVHDKIRGGNL